MSKECVRDKNLLIFSNKWYITIPRDTKITDDVVNEYRQYLFLLDTGELTHMLLPVGWELSSR